MDCVVAFSHFVCCFCFGSSLNRRRVHSLMLYNESRHFRTRAEVWCDGTDSNPIRYYWRIWSNADNIRSCTHIHICRDSGFPQAMHALLPPATAHTRIRSRQARWICLKRLFSFCVPALIDRTKIFCIPPYLLLLSCCFSRIPKST